MAKHQCIPLESPSEWKDALRGIKHAFGHTWENCYAMHLTSGYRTFLYRFESENVRIICPISERPFGSHVDIVSPFGFSGFVGNGDCPEFSRYWREFVRARGYVCGYFGSHPVFENGTYFDEAEYRPHNTFYMLNLTIGPEGLFSNLPKSRRRQVKKGEEQIFPYDTTRLKEFFLDNYYEFMKRKNAPGLYYFSKETLSFLLDLDNVLMFGAGTPDKVEAVSLSVYTPHMGDGLFNISLPEGRRHTVALIWRHVTELESRRVPMLNMGGTDRDNDGLREFKEQFGATKFPSRTLQQVYHPAVYAELCSRAGADPDDRAGYFPPYRNPGLR